MMPVMWQLRISGCFSSFYLQIPHFLAYSTQKCGRLCRREVSSTVGECNEIARVVLSATSVKIGHFLFNSVTLVEYLLLFIEFIAPLNQIYFPNRF